MSEQFTGGAETSVVDYDDISIEDMLAMGEAFAVSDEVQDKREAEFNKTLAELEERFGQQQFSYPPYVGTITDIINQCPAVAVLIPQGSDAVANFVSGHEVSNEEAEKLRNPEIVDEPTNDEEVDEMPVVGKAVNEEPKPASIEKVVENKQDKKMQALKEISTEPEQITGNIDSTPLPDAPAAITETPIQSEQQSMGGDTHEGVAVEEAQPIERVESPVVIDNDISAVISEQRGEKVVEKVSPDPVSAVKKKVETTPLPIVSKSKNTAELVERKVQIESASATNSAELDNDEEVASEIFHIPTVEAEEINSVPIESVVEDDEITLKIETIELAEDHIVEDLLPMDATVEQIRDVDEIADTESDAPEIAELNSELSDETASEPEHETVSLQSVLEREQSDGEVEPETVETVQSEAITETIIELVGKAPEQTVEYEPVNIQNYVAAIAEHIEVLEKSKNEQECRDAIVGLRKELAILLASLGYQDIDRHVERIIRTNHDMSELKRIMEMLLRAAIADESISNDMTQSTARPHHKFGRWVVRRTTTILQAA
ncbi:MAG: hypothetical protein JWN75_278 [Candidatus Saccharibacteria bacterium]|nr:hypothetical protein [Candidatus Saccharibacteria bacterium]